MGVGDQVPQAIEQLGAEVELDRAGRAGLRRPVRVQRHRDRCPRLRAPSGSPRQQPAAARLCRRRRHGPRAVQQVRVQRGAVRPVSGEGQRRAGHRRERAGGGPRAGSPGVHDAQQDRPGDVDRLGAGARTVFPRRARSALCRSAPTRPIRSTYNAGQRPARWSKRVSARAGGFTSASGSGGSCRPGPTARTACMANLLSLGSGSDEVRARIRQVRPQRELRGRQGAVPRAADGASTTRIW